MKINHKIPTLLLIAVMPFVFTACSSKQDKDESPETPPTTQSQPEYTNEEEPIPDSENTPRMDTGDNIITSVQEALFGNRVLKCEYKVEEDTFSMYLKGKVGALESETEVGDKKVKYTGLIKDDVYYIWSDQSSEGMKIPLAKNRDNPIEVNDQPVYSFDDIITQLETSKQSCTYASPDNSIFEIPTNISFQEW